MLLRTSPIVCCILDQEVHNDAVDVGVAGVAVMMAVSFHYQFEYRMFLVKVLDLCDCPLYKETPYTFYTCDAQTDTKIDDGNAINTSLDLVSDFTKGVVLLSGFSQCLYLYNKSSVLIAPQTQPINEI